MSYVMERMAGFSSFSRFSNIWHTPSIASGTVSKSANVRDALPAVGCTNMIVCLFMVATGCGNAARSEVSPTALVL